MYLYRLCVFECVCLFLPVLMIYIHETIVCLNIRLVGCWLRHSHCQLYISRVMKACYSNYTKFIQIRASSIKWENACLFSLTNNILLYHHTAYCMHITHAHIYIYMQIDKCLVECVIFVPYRWRYKPMSIFCGKCVFSHMCKLWTLDWKFLQIRTEIWNLINLNAFIAISLNQVYIYIYLYIYVYHNKSP